ncbi:unnamed protein product [Meganyctiphanes norvegica]|uniref:F-box domain-containing protein n=1 Tax=Meganyctiphanes norvegica TaxID=48144 RepID=A0AAV2ST16_MEGNR
MESYAELPATVLENIFSYLKVTDLLQVGKVCTTWQAPLNRTQFWLRNRQLDMVGKNKSKLSREGSSEIPETRGARPLPKQKCQLKTKR